MSVELTPVLPPKIGVSTQTYLFWAEWPDQAQNPQGVGWEIAPDEVTNPLCGVGMVRTGRWKPFPKREGREYANCHALGMAPV